MRRSDPELVKACQEGNQTAWTTLVDRYGRLVYSIPKRYGLSDSDADDVFAVVWASAFQKLPRLRDLTRLSAWLITTTHRECWRVSRKSSSSAGLNEAFEDVDSPSPANVLQWEQQQLVREALELLGGKCQALLTALFMEPHEPAYEHIAKRLDMPVGSIGPTRARCFKKLEKILVDLGFDSEASPADGGGKVSTEPPDPPDRTRKVVSGGPAPR